MAQELHRYTVQEALNMELGQGGVHVISDTNTKYGRFSRILCVTNTVFTTLTEEGVRANGIAFTSGSVEPNDGAMLVGNTSGAKATVISVTVTSGSFAAGTAAGTIELHPVSGAFQASETVTIKADTKVISSDALTTSTAANGGSNETGTMTGVSIPAGTVIDGTFTAIKLTSGLVRAFRG